MSEHAALTFDIREFLLSLELNREPYFPHQRRSRKLRKMILESLEEMVGRAARQAYDQALFDVQERPRRKLPAYHGDPTAPEPVNTAVIMARSTAFERIPRGMAAPTKKNRLTRIKLNIAGLLKVDTNPTDVRREYIQRERGGGSRWS